MAVINQVMNLSMDSNTVNGINATFNGNTLVAADGGNVTTDAIVPPPGQIFTKFTPQIQYQPFKHIPLVNSSTNNIILSDIAGQLVLSKNYPSVDVDIGGTLQTLVLGTDANVETISNTTLGTNGYIVPNSLHNAGCIQLGNYIYLIGGQNSVSGAASSSVYRALINSDGSLNGWVDTTNPLPQPVFGMLLVRSGNYLYSINGYTTGIINNVYYCTINPDNTLGAWSDTGVDMPVAGGNVTGFAYNNYIYILSSWPDGSSGPTTQAYYSTVSSTGVLGGWLDLPYNLPAYAYAAAVAQLGLNVYVIGGGNNSVGSTNIIYSMSINPDGTLTQPQTVSGALPYPLTNAVSAIVGDVLYVISGSSNASNSIIQSTITNDTIGPWSVASISLPVVLQGMSVINTGTNLYVIGGDSIVNSPSPIYQASVTNGVIGPWLSTSTIPTLPTKAEYAAYLENNNILYMFGGNTGGGNTTNIYSASINSTSGIGTWILSTTTLPFAGSNLPMAVIGNFVYLFGGWNGTAASDVVYSSTINTDGTLSAFVNTNQNLPIATCSTQAYSNGSYVYLFGNYNSGSGSNAIYYAPITNSTIGTWVKSTIVLPASIYNVSWTQVGTSVFIVGNNTTTVYIASFDNTGMLTGIVDTTLAIPSVNNAPQIVASGDYLYYIGGNNSSGNAYNIYQSSYVNGILSPWATIPTFMAPSLTAMGVVISGSYLYVLGGAINGSTTNSIWPYDINPVSNYSLVPTSPFTAIPAAVYLTANLQAKALVGDISKGDALVALSSPALTFDSNSGTYTYKYNELTATKNGNNVYVGVQNLNAGDVVTALGGIITGTLVASSSSVPPGI